MLSEIQPGVADAITRAKGKIQAGPKPGWVVESSYNGEFKGENIERQCVKLLLDRQIHAESHENYVHEAVRLETMEAVQHLSQWSFQFEPQEQAVTFHFIRLKRGSEVFEQLDLTKGHVIQREEGLNHLTIDGWFTYLQVLEDVRPGDILEWSYTVCQQGGILRDYCMQYLLLPEWVSIGKYQVLAHFRNGRPMQWKTSSAELTPQVTEADGITTWRWQAEKYQGLKREPHTPFWYVSAPWIQISDCPDWRTVATAMANAWKKPEGNQQILDDLTRQIEKDRPALADRIDAAIQLIQDEFRYLSVNLELGGAIPAAPETVARRRYGDCKDLSLLLVHLLKRWGVSARPILVHTTRRKTVRDMLPAPFSFNHAITEFEAEDKRRWVDLTSDRQGGGAFNRYVANFGVGLPVDEAATGLVEQPHNPDQSNLYELHETIQVSTNGGTSLVAWVVHAEGGAADRLRNQLAVSGATEMAKANLQNFANRFNRKSKRVGEMKYRDDRMANQFFTAEVFEVDTFMEVEANRRACRIPIPSHWIKNTLVKPEQKERRTPFALPFPCELVHIIEVASNDLNSSVRRKLDPKRSLESQHVQFQRTSRFLKGYWALNLSVTIRADSVLPDQLNQHREFVQSVWKESLWNLILPLGHGRPKPRGDFGELPLPKLMDFKPRSHISTDEPHVDRSNTHQVQPATKAIVPEVNNSFPVATVAKTKLPAITPPATSKSRSRRSPSHSGSPDWSQKKVLIIGFILILGVLLLLLFATSGDFRPPR